MSTTFATPLAESESMSLREDEWNKTDYMPSFQDLAMIAGSTLVPSLSDELTSLLIRAFSASASDTQESSRYPNTSPARFLLTELQNHLALATRDVRRSVPRSADLTTYPRETDYLALVRSVFARQSASLQSETDIVVRMKPLSARPVSMEITSRVDVKPIPILDSSED